MFKQGSTVLQEKEKERHFQFEVPKGLVLFHFSLEGLLSCSDLVTLQNRVIC